MRPTSRRSSRTRDLAWTTVAGAAAFVAVLVVVAPATRDIATRTPGVIALEASHHAGPVRLAGAEGKPAGT